MLVAKNPEILRETFILNIYYLLVIISPLRFIEKKVGFWPKMPENVEISTFLASQKVGKKWSVSGQMATNFAIFRPFFTRGQK